MAIKPQLKPRRALDAKYLAFVRTKPCVAQGFMCDPSIEANHIVRVGHGKVGSKTDDSRSLPFCVHHHRHYHDDGREQFEAQHGVDLEKQIRLLNAEYELTQKKLPIQRARTYQPRASVKIDRCGECRKSHDLSWSKVLGFDGELPFVSYVCPISNRRVTARKGGR